MPGQAVLFRRTQRAARLETVIAILPGYPDNINRSSDGIIGWRSLACVRPRSISLSRCPASGAAWRGGSRPTNGSIPISTPAASCKFDDKGEILEALWDLKGTITR